MTGLVRADAAARFALPGNSGAARLNPTRSFSIFSMRSLICMPANFMSLQDGDTQPHINAYFATKSTVSTYMIQWMRLKFPERALMTV